MRLLTVLFAFYFSLGTAVAQTFPSDRFPSQIQVEQLNGTLPGAASGSQSARNINQLSIDFIKLWEGWSPISYDDPAGYCTIGYGHLIKKDLCANITDPIVNRVFEIPAGDRLLIKDTLPARRTVEKLVTINLNENQFGALVSFVFNVGAANFSKSTMLKLLNLNQPNLAAAQFSLWIKARGQILRGLRNRRACEIELFHGRLTRDVNGAINVGGCQALAASPNAAALIDIEMGE